jgi:ABC-type oligopeptide transport system ATPase subunit
MSYIFISHDLSVVRYMSDHVLVMQHGEVVEQGASDAVFSRPQHPYTRKLLSAIPGAHHV